MYGPPNLGVHISVNKPVEQNYSGPEDEKSGMSEGIGSILYKRDDYMQNYEGKFIWNNMHGYGEYRWQPPDNKYEGQLYVNKKEGYGRFSYPSGAYFEGLYRNDQRFGPGIYTDAKGYQDVGIWVASKLIRLSRTFEPDCMVPRLAVRDEDKITVLRYRQIIHLQKEKVEHIAENLLKSLTHSRNYDKAVLARNKELYNRLCRDDRAPTFNKPRYDETFFGNDSEELTIDVLMTEEEIQQEIAEKREAIELEDSPSDNIPQIDRSKIFYRKQNFADGQPDVQYVGEISQQDKNLEVSQDKDEKEEEELDYCGIKRIDVENMNDALLTGNHEDQWNVFQSPAITTPQDVFESSDVNFLNEENLQGLVTTETSEEKFDDLEKKKTKNIRPTKKIVVTDLMAWNNSSISIDLLKHVFKHRNFEKKLSFDISKVLAGRRGSFRQEGTHEKAAMELLEACSNGFQNRILRLISRQNLDVDVADSRGNTGLLLAAARDRIGVIDALLNLGANVDSINDECVTPLSLCVLRLLELIHSVTDWSKAFLPKRVISESIADDESVMLKKFEQWHGRISYKSLVKQLPKRMDWSGSPIENNSEFYSKDFPTKSESAIGNAIHAELDIATNKVIKSKVQTKQEMIQKQGQHRDMKENYDTDGMQSQKYIFDMSPIIGTSDPWRKFKNDKTRNRNTKIKAETKREKKPKERNIPSESKELQEIEDINNSNVSAKLVSVCSLGIPICWISLLSKYTRRSAHYLHKFYKAECINREVTNCRIEKISATMSKLLQRGADPNFAQVPYPVLIMAIFTKTPSLVSQLLEYGADPNTTLSKVDHFLTPLLILATLQPAYEHAVMAQVLLKAKADPSIRADPDYRSDLMERLKRNRLSEFIESSQGMTALHLLAIRSDIDTDMNESLGELIRVIYQHGCIKNSDLYQGHSPLSLAIVEGNLAAVKAFLRTTYVNVNEQLGTDLGNAMFMLESCMLQELLPPDLLQEFLELLLEYGGCPFVSARVRNQVIIVLKEEYNQIEYGRKELMTMLNPSENIVQVKEIKKKSKFKGSKNSKPPDTRYFAKSIQFIEKIAKEKLIQRIKENFVKDLIDSPLMLLPTEKKSVLLKEPIFRNALTWMTGEDLAIVMKSMNCNRSHIRELLIRNEVERIMNKVMPLIDQRKHSVTSTDFKVERNVSKGETKNFPPILVCPPELDPKDNRFKVCFECLTVHGKVLILCPKCKQVYFCSQKCNVRSTMQEGNLHQCPVFYQMEWIRLEKIATTIDLDPINYMLGIYKDPEMYTYLEKKIGRFIEPIGKKSWKNQDENTDSNTPKCKDQDSMTYKKYGANEVIDKNGYQHEDTDDSANRVKDKQQKGNGKIKTEDKDNNFKSTKKQKNSRTFDSKDENIATGNIKSNEKETGHLSKIKTRSSDNIKLKNEKDALSKIKSKKRIKNSPTNWDAKDEEAGDSDIRSKPKKKNNFEDNGENKTKSKTDKTEGQIKEDSGNNMKLKEGKHKVRDFNDREDDNNSKFKSKNNVSKDIKNKKTLNYLYKNENDDTKENRHKKHEARHNKQESKNEINKKTREGDLNASNERSKNDRHYVETNVPEEYLDRLLKVSRSAAEHLDIDMLLLPYIIFAQGDTYFRILPADRHPECPGNYSLI